MIDAGQIGLEQAIAQAAVSGESVWVPPGNHDVCCELQVTSPVRICGAPGDRSVIRATQPMRSTVGILAGHCRLEHVVISGDHKADHAIYGSNCGRSVFENVICKYGIRDGFHLPRDGNNNQLDFRRVRFWNNGRIYASDAMNTAPVPGNQVVRHGGTVSIVQGSTQVTGVGTLFTQTAARSGDFIRIGSHVYEVGNADTTKDAGGPPLIDSDTSLQLATPAEETLSSAEYSIHVGGGYYECRYGDNNQHVFDNCHARGNASCGLEFNGLYGSTVIGGIVDTHALWGVAVGRKVNNSVIYRSRHYGTYFEGNVLGPYVMYGGRGVSIIEPMHNVSGELVSDRGSNTYSALMEGRWGTSLKFGAESVGVSPGVRSLWVDADERLRYRGSDNRDTILS